jgi:hypothetical protein
MRLYGVPMYKYHCDEILNPQDFDTPLSTLSDPRSNLSATMSRKILAGFGVDVDAVAGWYVISIPS